MVGDDSAADEIDLRMMGRALARARRAAAAGEVPVGAVVYRGEEVLAEAFNQRELAQDPTGHAEMLAIREAARRLGSWRLSGCTLAVTLEPCPMCAGAMLNARLPRLVYGAADPKMGCVDTLYRLCDDARFNHRAMVVRGVLAEECGRVLKDFFRDRRGTLKPPKPGSAGLG
jgi:tRNA(adenine34) deaminase